MSRMSCADLASLAAWPGVRRASLPRQSPPLTPGRGAALITTMAQLGSPQAEQPFCKRPRYPCLRTFDLRTYVMNGAIP